MLAQQFLDDRPVGTSGSPNNRHNLCIFVSKFTIIWIHLIGRLCFFKGKISIFYLKMMVSHHLNAPFHLLPIKNRQLNIIKKCFAGGDVEQRCHMRVRPQMKNHFDLGFFLSYFFVCCCVHTDIPPPKKKLFILFSGGIRLLLYDDSVFSPSLFHMGCQHVFALSACGGWMAQLGCNSWATIPTLF